MKRILCFILTIVVGLCCCVSCSNNELSYGFSLNNFKTQTGMYLAIKASENQKVITLSIYCGNDFYNDENFLSSPNSVDNKYVLSIKIVHKKSEKTVFFKNLDDFSHLDYDCVFNDELAYKKKFIYSIQKEELEQDVTIKIALTSLAIADESFYEVYQKIKYKKGKKLLIES